MVIRLDQGVPYISWPFMKLCYKGGCYVYGTQSRTNSRPSNDSKSKASKAGRGRPAVV